MNEKSISAALLDAVMFAAERHKNQRRKDAEASPYVNHPIALAHLLATTGGIEDLTVLQAAILHDTIEDTETTEAELRERFGDEVTNIVLEVTDDKALPKQRRKEFQVEHALHKSKGAALVKLADKTCNLRDIAISPPTDWPLSRRQEYFDWAKRVVDRLPRVNEAMLRAFEQAYAARPHEPSSSPPKADEGEWLRMPGGMSGMCGFVRLTDSGDIEVELYDHSEGARSAFDSDVSTIYTVRKDDLPALAERLAEGFGGPTPSIASLPGQLTTFSDVQDLIVWLTTKSGVPVAKRVDFDV
ncbi:bifunctional (p)ppGpp synthetase/guanosine-3',5'-bis(diphosphate) 3'-pyrophosphohydrolase [Pandoraea pnomenusa]|nr:bifunctional (p)ppGpp synthetase/guanosine-3',5'-bis(diphosphate) 3'-pyrophosphohydrolase [Pandoraea pnomenusa]